MKIQRMIKLVRDVWDVLHSERTSSQEQDLNEYEKVKKEFKHKAGKKGKSTRYENRDVSAI